MKKILYLLLFSLLLLGCKDKEETDDNYSTTYSPPATVTKEQSTQTVASSSVPENKTEERELDVNIITEDNYFDKYDATPEFIIEDDTNMRSCPSTNCDIVGTLKLGEEIKILERSENSEVMSGINSNWYKVKSNNKIGWIFGTKIARHVFKSNADDGVLFLAALKKVDNDDQSTYQIKAVKDNNLIASKEFIGYNYKGVGLQNIGSMGISVDDILKIEIPCNGGCGCNTGDVYLFWHNHQFSQPYEAMGVADAWASQGTTFIFPRELNGIPNTIIKEKVTYEGGDGDSDDSKVKRKRVTDYLIWDGAKLIPHPTKESKSITYWVKS